jgi:alpha-glucosidase
MNVFSNHDSKRSVSNMAEFAVKADRRRDGEKLLAFMQFALKGGGILFQGEELGLTQPTLAYDDLQDAWGKNLWPDFEGRDGARTPMPWLADDARGGFSSGEPWLPVAEEHRALAVDKQEADPNSNLQFVRHLLAWRREQPLLKWGGERVHRTDVAPLIVWDRFGEGRTFTCIANFSLQETLFPCRDAQRDGLVSVPGSVAQVTEHGVVLGPLAFAILERKDGNAAPDDATASDAELPP